MTSPTVGAYFDQFIYVQLLNMREDSGHIRLARCRLRILKRISVNSFLQIFTGDLTGNPKCWELGAYPSKCDPCGTAASTTK